MLNLAQLEKDLEAKRQEGLTLLGTTMQAAEADDRVMTEVELASIDRITKDAQDIQNKIARSKGHDAMRDQLQALTGGVTGKMVQQIERRSMGQQFAESEAMEFFKKRHHRTSSAWRSPSVELLDPAMHATTLTSDPASGGKLILPDYRTGILQPLYRRIVIADLLASGTTDSNLIQYMKETAFTNAAAPVLEGAAKPESALTFDAATDPVRKLAHWLPVTEEMLEDVPQIRSYIDARLRLGLDLAEEDQLWNGTGVAPQILGVTKRSGLAAPIVRVDPWTNADAFYVQAMAIYASSFLMPDGIVVNPANWIGIALTKSTTGEYLAGGPFSPLLGQTLWGMPVAVTPVQAAGIGWVGAFKQAAQVFRHGGVRVEASNSHQDFFIKNLVAIRAEERLALAVYRPGAIGSVTTLTGAPMGAVFAEGGGLGAGRGGSLGLEEGRENGTEGRETTRERGKVR